MPSIKQFVTISLFIFPGLIVAQNPFQLNQKYGLVKKDAHGYYNTQDTILNDWTQLENSWQDNYTKTIYCLSDTARFNLTLCPNGNFVYNNYRIKKYSIQGDYFYLDKVKPIYRRRITHLSVKSYKISQHQDTIVLTTNKFSLYYLPAYKLTDSVYHERKITEAKYGWGITTGVNYQFNSLFYEIGVSKSELSNDVFYAGDFHFDYDAINNIAGFNVSAYMGGVNPILKKGNNRLGRIAIGSNINLYTDFDKINIGLKPLMVGYNLIRYKTAGLYVFYGYNIFLNKKRIDQLNHHVVECKINIPLFIHKEKHISHQMYYWNPENGGGAYGLSDTDL